MKGDSDHKGIPEYRAEVERVVVDEGAQKRGPAAKDGDHTEESK